MCDALIIVVQWHDGISSASADTTRCPPCTTPRNQLATTEAVWVYMNPTWDVKVEDKPGSVELAAASSLRFSRSLTQAVSPAR
jgi:hypothetical protein